MAGAGLCVGNRVHLRAAPATMARMIRNALLLTGAALIADVLERQPRSPCSAACTFSCWAGVVTAANSPWKFGWVTPLSMKA